MPLPDSLDAVVTDFAMSPEELKTELLLEKSDDLPPLPEGMDSSEMEQVEECQSPFFLATRVADDETVTLYFDAPREAPTTRGFAGILHEGLNGRTRQEILDVEDDFYDRMELGRLISPLRMRGMAAILFRLKRQLRDPR